MHLLYHWSNSFLKPTCRTAGSHCYGLGQSAGKNCRQRVRIGYIDTRISQLTETDAVGYLTSGRQKHLRGARQFPNEEGTASVGLGFRWVLLWPSLFKSLCTQLLIRTKGISGITKSLTAGRHWTPTGRKMVPQCMDALTRWDRWPIQSAARLLSGLRQWDWWS